MSQTFKSYPINKLSFQAFPCHVALAVGLPFRDQRRDVCRHPFWDWHAALGKGYTAILEFPSHLKISKIHLKILKVKKVQAVFLAGTFCSHICYFPRSGEFVLSNRSFGNWFVCCARVSMNSCSVLFCFGLLCFALLCLDWIWLDASLLACFLVSLFVLHCLAIH